MLEILQFIFSSFWTFAGTIILILAIGAMIPNVNLNYSSRTRHRSD